MYDHEGKKDENLDNFFRKSNFDYSSLTKKIQGKRWGGNHWRNNSRKGHRREKHGILYQGVKVSNVVHEKRLISKLVVMKFQTLKTMRKSWSSDVRPHTKDGIGNLNGKIGNQKTIKQCLQKAEGKLFTFQNSILSQTIEQM